MAVIASVAAMTCAPVGCYLVLRRLSLLGDAISHAVLPGLVIAFLLTGKVGGWPAVLGALCVGALTSWLMEWVHRGTGVPEDAGLGVVFTTLFALGVLLLGLVDNADLDPGCVLFGVLEPAPLDTLPLLGWEIPRTLFTLVPMLLLSGALFTLFWKEVQLTAFDPQHAAAAGLPTAIVHHGILTLTAGVVVASFEAVGAVLVVAMLIVPAVTAQRLTRRLHTMMLVAVLLAGSAGMFGTLMAVILDTSVAG
ncbi:MAG: metal ABC transporter permease, partial [Phycisphaerales bacterium]|nr:metal ABC transporter permease [Phycisphaerales bacterium]